MSRHPKIQDCLDDWHIHVQKGHIIDNVRVCGAENLDDLLELEKKARTTFENEIQFCGLFKFATPEENVLFLEFRGAIQRSQGSILIKARFFLASFCNVVFANYAFGLKLICEWTAAIQKVQYEYHPSMVFAFSRMFVHREAHKSAIQRFLFEDDRTFARLKSLVYEKDSRELTLLWDDIQFWYDYQAKNNANNMLHVLDEVRCLETSGRPFMLLHAPAQLVPKPQVPKMQYFDSRDNYIALRRTMGDNVKFPTRNGLVVSFIEFQKLFIQESVVNQWKSYIQATAKISNKCQLFVNKLKSARKNRSIQLKVVNKWRRFIQVQKCKQTSKKMIQAIETRVCMQKIMTIACQLNVLQHWQYCVNVSKEHLRKFKKWRKRAQKILLKQRKIEHQKSIQAAKKEAKLQAQQEQQRLLMHREQEAQRKKSIMIKYFHKWKLFYTQHQLQVHSHRLQKVKVAQFILKRKMNHLQMYVRRWKTFVVARRMHQFYLEKQLIAFAGHILSLVMDKLHEEFDNTPKCANCKTEDDSNCQCDFQIWTVTKLLFVEYSAHNLVLLSPSSTFVEILHTVAKLDKHAFVKMFIDCKMFRKFSAILELTNTLHRSYRRMKDIFVKISRFGVKSAMNIILDITLRLIPSRDANKEIFDQRVLRWARHNEVTKCFGVRSTKTCKDGIDVWFDVTKTYYQKSGKKDHHFSIFETILKYGRACELD